MEEQLEDWTNTLEQYCKKSFVKIRVREKFFKKSSADEFINQRNKLDKKAKKTVNENNLKKSLEQKISINLEEEGKSLAYKFKKFSVQSSRTNFDEMWKLKKKVWPKNILSAPSAKLNHKMKLISDPKQLKLLLAKEYKERLRRRPVKPDFLKLKD